MKLDVPYYSQYKDVVREEWRARACSITCLKMALEYASHGTIPTIDDLIDQAVALNGWGIDGWIQDSLVVLSHNFGIPAYRREFRSMHYDTISKTFSPSVYGVDMFHYGVEAILDTLDDGNPVIVSSYRDWDIAKSFHTFLLVGYSANQLADGRNAFDGFYFHDPDAKEGKREFEYISRKDFEKAWRKFAIFVEKHDKND